jgi:hypothetical protein
MTDSFSMKVLAESSAALVQDYDLAGAMVQVVVEATEALRADAGGLLVANADDGLELLSATSHEAAELETYQAFSGEGPCTECMRTQSAIGLGLEAVESRWPDVARLMESAGYRWVLATPLRWRGTALGGLNLFFARAPDDETDRTREAQVFSDILTLFIVNAQPISPVMLRLRVELALTGRAVIEQAKGVLAEQEGLDMAAAYRRLLELQAQNGDSLSDVARSLIREAQVGDREN